MLEGLRKFESCIDSIMEYLVSAGYPSRLLSVPAFSALNSPSVIAGIRDRQCRSGTAAKASTNRCRDAVYIVVPFSSQAKSLNISRMFSSCLSSSSLLDNLNIKLRVAWGTKLNSMRRLYRFNWPVAGAQSMGIG